MHLFSLEQKTAVITGATRGLGQAMALALAEAGAHKIALVQRDPDQTDTQRQLQALGCEVLIIPCDLSDKAQVQQVIPQAIEQFGQVDILLNNAGIVRRSPSVSFTDEDWHDVLEVNLHAAFYLCRAAGQHMTARNCGKIINIASVLSFQGGLTVPAYAAAKGGIAQLTKALANEWAHFGVNVNAIAPGYMATDMNEALIDDPIRSRQIMERIPAGRWGSPDDLKGAVVYLASPASNYVNGHILTVDGGWLGR